MIEKGVGEPVLDCRVVRCQQPKPVKYECSFRPVVDQQHDVEPLLAVHVWYVNVAIEVVPVPVGFYAFRPD